MNRITAHQWMLASSLLLLGPALRLLPRLAAEDAGRAVWLGALPALPLLLFYARFLSRFWASRPEGGGLGETTLRLLGPRRGRAALFFYSAWLLFYAGFTLRSGADRLVTTVYPQSAPAVFVLSMGLCCLAAALGSARSLARTGALLYPFVMGILLLLLFSALKGTASRNLFPVTLLDLPAVTRASLPVLDVLGLGLFLPLFFLGFVETREQELLPRYTRWLLGESLLLTLLMLVVIGCFGAELVARLSQPFFTLVRNLVFFRSLERIEALVVCCWIFPDFLLVSLCLYAAQFCLRLALGRRPQNDRGQRLDGGQLRWLIPFCGLAAILVGLLLAPDVLSLRRLSERVIPGINLVLSFLTVPLLSLVEHWRRRRKAAP